jgi:hypothetical protein
MDAYSRAYFEPRFGHDFGRVRVHDDSRAAVSARAVGAHAYTAGDHIIFGTGEYAPDTNAGRKLLAHELTHVMQQAGAYRTSSSHKVGPLGAVTTSGTRIQRDIVTPSARMSAEDLVDTYSLQMLNEQYDQIAQMLFTNYIARGMNHSYVTAVFEKLDSDWEDNVGALFTEKLTDAQLDSIAGSYTGRAMLSVLYDAMITGSVSKFEREQATRVLNAKARQLKPEDYLASERRRPSGGKTQIFPVRNMRITPGYDDAPLMAELTPEGKVRAEYPTRVKYAKTFAAEVSTLQEDTFLSDGQILNPNEIVGIKDYESGGSTQYLPALALIDYSNRVKHSTLGKIATVAAVAATAGLAGPGLAAEEGGKWAARLALADKVANVAQVVSGFVGENRDWIIDNLGWPGRQLVKASEVADSIIAIYGIARLGHAGFQIATDLRAASRAAREKANSLTNVELTANELKQLDQVELQTQKLEEELQNVEASESAGQAAAPTTAPPAEKPPTPAGKPSPHAGTEPAQPVKPPAQETGLGAGGAAKKPPGPGVEEGVFKSVNELEHEGVAAKITTADGHEITIAKDGRAWICTDPCELFGHRYGSALTGDDQLAKTWKEIQELTNPNQKAEALRKLRPKIEAAHRREVQYLPLESTYRRGARQGNALRMEPDDWNYILKRHVKRTFDSTERQYAPTTTLFKGSPEEYLDILYEATETKAVTKALTTASVGGNSKIPVKVRNQDWILEVDAATDAIKGFYATGNKNPKLFEVIKSKY